VTAGIVVFACGGRIIAREDPAPVCHRARDGRLRLVVYDSDRHPSRPKIVTPPSGAPDDDGDVRVMGCLHGCAHKRAGARRQVRCFSERGLPVRWIVTCLGTWVPKDIRDGGDS